MIKTPTLLIAVFFSSFVFAQQNKTEEIAGTKTAFVSKSTGLPGFVSIDWNAHVSGTNFAGWMTNNFVKNTEVSFQQYKSEPDQSGMTHTRYHEYYKGYELDGSMLMTHGKGNEISSFSGEWYKDIKLQNSLALSEKEALAYALKKINAKRYKWENKAEEAQMRQATGNPNFSYKPTVKVVILPSLENGVSYHYAYKFDIYAEFPVSRRFVYVDASSGAILKEKNILCTANAVASANTKYSGTQAITTDSYTGGYRLRETGRGNGIETYNLNNSGTYSNTDFTNSSTAWTSTGTNQTATDAHWGAEKTYDFYYNTFNRNSIDNAGFKLLSYVHASLVAMGYPDNVNAFWDGQRMTYGDGDASQGFSVMTALDVCGHEITHGVVENSANLGTGEAAALNEAFADIFGTSIEWYARPSQHDWIIGKDITTNGLGIRNMSNPNQLQQPDTYHGTYWDTGGEEHTNNGPCIFWFYLLSVGGAGTNDNSQAYNVTGITMAEAEAIAYRALTVYMTPNTTYADVRNYTIQAAKDLYGSCSNEVIQTTNAWYAVGVGTAYTIPSIGPAFAGDILSSCNLPLTVQFNNTTNAASSYTWRFGDGTTSTAVAPAHTYTANGTYTVKLKAVSCSSTTSDSVTKTSYIIINSPTVPTATGAVVCSGGTASLTASGNATIKWYNAVTGGTLLATGNNYITPAIGSSTTYYAVNTTTQAPVFGGPANNTVFGGGSYFTVTGTDHYQTFNVLQPCTLKTVTVYSGAAGNRIIQLRNSASAVITSTTINVASGTQTVTLNFPLNPGNNYQLALSGTSPVTNLYRNNAGSGYPYNINSLVNITGNDVGSTYYYYFYNWQVQADGCQSAPVAVTATVNNGGTVTVSNASVCAGSTTTLSASGATSYTWTGGPTTANYAISPSGTSIYTVSGLFSGGCTGTNTAQVTVSSLPSTSVLSASICAGATATLTASGANSYAWNTGASGANLLVSPSSTTNYTVTGTSAAGCAKTATGTVVVGSGPAISLNSATVCAGSAVTLSASGVTSYSWTSGPNTATYSVTPSATTIYTVSGNLTGCAATAVTTATITVNALPVLSVNSSTICAGETATLNATGAAAYAWDNGATGSLFNASPTSSVIYTLTGTSTASCVNTATAGITVTPAPLIAVTSASVCAGSGATLTASGVSTYTWSTGVTSSNLSVTGSVTTIYTINGYLTGCSVLASETATLTIYSLPVVGLAAAKSKACVNNSPIALSGTPVGGTYSGAGVSGNSFNPLVAGAGTYTLMYSYTDGNNCSASASKTMTVDLCTGIEEMNADDILVYPNPASDHLVIQLTTDMINTTSVELYDATGKLVLAEKAKEAMVVLHTESLAKGLYHVRIVSEKGQAVRTVSIQ
jgi:Zn-dependent metalloprotease